MSVSSRAALSGSRTETLLLGVGAALAFALLPQARLHGTDVFWLLRWLDEPIVHPQHPAYLPLARGLRWLLQPFGVDGHALLLLFSALGGGIAVAGLHRAALLLCGDAAFARGAALIAAGTPALLHFATTAELHAPFAAAMAWCTWAAVRQANAPTARAALVTGLLCGGATLLHATGHLMLPCIAVAVWWCHRGRGARWALGHLALLAAAHGGLWAAVFLATRQPLPNAPLGHPAAYFARFFADMHFWPDLWPTIWIEWIVSYAPISLLWLAALAVPRLRGLALLLVPALAAYVFASVVLIHAVTDERGAYLLPLLLPMAALSLGALPRRAWPWLAAATLLAGALLRGEPGRELPDHAFGRAAAAYARQAPTVFLVADVPEMDGAFLADLQLDLVVAFKEEVDLERTAGAAVTLTQEQLAAWLELHAHRARARGARLVVTDLAVAWLQRRQPAFAPAWRAFAERAGAQRLDAASGLAGVVIGG
jgi:hypothetical protein